MGIKTITIENRTIIFIDDEKSNPLAIVMEKDCEIAYRFYDSRKEFNAVFQALSKQALQKNIKNLNV